MIGMLRGTVARIDSDTFILDVSGVGYELSATPRLMAGLTVGQDVQLAVETLVGETFLRLVGFASESDRQTFRMLQSVQGVGAKAALSILHVLSPHELLDAVTFEDKTSIFESGSIKSSKDLS